MKALPFWQCSTAALPTWYIGGFANVSQAFLAIISDSGVIIVSVSHCTHSRLKHAVTPWLLICSCIMILQSHNKECKPLEVQICTAVNFTCKQLLLLSISARAQPAKRLIGDCSASSDMVHEIITPTLLHAFTGVATLASCIAIVPTSCHGTDKLMWHVVINS